VVRRRRRVLADDAQLARELGTNQLVEHFALFVRQYNLSGNSHSRSPHRLEVL
jgi:hypothetical protein